MRTVARVLIGVAALLAISFAEVARADDITLRYDPVTTDDVGQPLPAGTVTYRIFQQAPSETAPRQVGETPATNFVRPNVAIGQHCFQAQALFVPTSPILGETWQPSELTPLVCHTVTAPGGPRERRPARIIVITVEQRSATP